MCDNMNTGPNVSPLSAISIRATQSDPVITPAIASLGTNASVDVTLAALGLAHTDYISFANAGAALAQLKVELIVAGESRQNFLGLELGATNANPCMANACGKGVCLGGLEPLVVRITNLGSPLGATDAMTMRLQRYFPGDGVKYTCSSDITGVQRAAACDLPACERTPIG